MTITAISCNERSTNLNTDPKGWRQIDEKKTYTTFRNGKLVSASGYEGYRLACGDKSKAAKNKENLSNQRSDKRKFPQEEIGVNTIRHPKKSKVIVTTAL